MIRIVTDTASDITPAEAMAMQVELVPLSIVFPSASYDEATDEGFARFYKLLEGDNGFPKTSQPSPEAFARVFQEAKECGDSVVAILISGGLSGTVQSAQIARDMVGHDDVHIIDCRTAIAAQRILVVQAVKMRDNGQSAAEIAAEIVSLSERVKVYGIISTLHYLYKGGRLSRTVALAGDLLRIRPIITTRGGVIKLVGKGRNAMSLLSWFTENGGHDPEYPVYFGYTTSDEKCKQLMTYVTGHYPIQETGIYPIGGTIGAHVGPHGVSIAFVTAKQ